MVALCGNAAPVKPVLPAWPAAIGGALGIRALNRGTFLGAWIMLGLFRFAWASLTLCIRLDGGKRWPCTRAGGVILRMCGLRVSTFLGGRTLWILLIWLEL
jgi:hypothetical protein